MGSSEMEPQLVSRTKTHQPCAACKMLRRRCDNSCVLAPYFPNEKRENFAIVHKVFGASNVIKMIRMVEATHKEDAIKAIVYEATARLRDPVYGSAGATYQLQKMVQQLKMELESVNTRIIELQETNKELFHHILLDLHRQQHHQHQVSPANESIVDCHHIDIAVDDATLRFDPVIFPIECDWIL